MTTQKQVDDWNKALRDWLALPTGGFRTDNGRKVMLAIERNPRDYIVKHEEGGYGVCRAGGPLFARPVSIDVARGSASRSGIATDFAWNTAGHWELLAS